MNTATLLDRERLIELYPGLPSAPCLIAIGGLHGNEPAGITAMQGLRPLLRETPALGGAVYFLRGNLHALRQGRRFLQEDLNRIWRGERLRNWRTQQREGLQPEAQQALELLDLINLITAGHEGPCYLLDLHTTSAPSIPFITLDDALLQRKFASCFPMARVLGLEEYLQGTLLNYFHQRGWICLGIEGGQHRDTEAVKVHYHVLLLALRYSGILPEAPGREAASWKYLARVTEDKEGFYDVRYREYLEAGEDFRMRPGFRSFQWVRAHTCLGYRSGKPLYLEGDRLLFMPRYQPQGRDAFFLLRRLPPWLMAFSALLRKCSWDGLMALLPGVSRVFKSPGQLRITAFWWSRYGPGIFHLLGYRVVQTPGPGVGVQNRDSFLLPGQFSSAPWWRRGHKKRGTKAPFV